jgi:hypothetical protein
MYPHRSNLHLHVDEIGWKSEKKVQVWNSVWPDSAKFRHLEKISQTFDTFHQLFNVHNVDSKLFFPQ